MKVVYPPLNWSDTERVFSNVPDFDRGVEPGMTEVYRFPVMNESVTRLLARRLDMHLVALDLIFMRDSVFAAMRELITNAVRANAKTKYLAERGVDPSNPEAYAAAMKGFKAYFVENLPILGDALIREERLTTVVFETRAEGLTLKFSNNRKLLAFEKDRVENRMREARAYRDLAEAFKARGDETEGAGIGLIMTLMMLKADGLPPQYLALEVGSDDTHFILTLPRMELRSSPQGLKKAEPLMQKVESLPSFPKTISDIQNLLKDPQSSLVQISAAVKKDPGLSGNLLKLANSAAFRRGSPVENLDRAIAVIGLKDLGDILYTLGSRLVMEKVFPSYQGIAERSNLSAFYAKEIARAMGLDRDEIGHVVSAALLHDLGEIILISMERNSMMKIRGWAQSKALASCLTLEEAAFGITHTRLSGLLAEKWEFPSIYATAMEYHHRPLLVPEPYRNVVWPIYLADQMIERESHPVGFNIPEEVLSRCKMDGSRGFASLHTLVHEGLKKAL